MSDPIKPTPEQETAAKGILLEPRLMATVSARDLAKLVAAVAALIAERDAARAEREALVIKSKPVSYLVRLEREDDPGFSFTPHVPMRVMDDGGLYWSVAAPPSPEPAKEKA